MMSEDIQTNEYIEGQTGIVPTVRAEINPVEISDLPTAEYSAEYHTGEVAEKSWKEFQVNAIAFWNSLIRSTVSFFQENRRLLSLLTWVFFVFLGLKIFLASLDVIDDIPLMSFLLKTIGLVYVAQFGWRNLVWASDRQELAGKFDRAKAEFLGS